MADYELICSKMSQLRRKGNKAMALCPAHDDKSHSLSILYREADDRVLLNCFAQDCSAAASWAFTHKPASAAGCGSGRVPTSKVNKSL